MPSRITDPDLTVASRGTRPVLLAWKADNLETGRRRGKKTPHNYKGNQTQTMDASLFFISLSFSIETVMPRLTWVTSATTENPLFPPPIPAFEECKRGEAISFALLQPLVRCHDTRWQGQQRRLKREGGGKGGERPKQWYEQEGNSWVSPLIRGFTS